MTVIAVKKENNKIIIWSDSQWTMWSHKSNLQDNTKLFNLWDIIFWSSWLFSESNFMNIYLLENKPTLKTEIDFAKFFCNFEKWLSVQTNWNINKSENSYIFIVNWKIFKIWKFEIIEIKDFRAIWSGWIQALMGLELWFDVEKTLKAVCKYDLFCNEPINIIEINL